MTITNDRLCVPVGLDHALKTNGLTWGLSTGWYGSIIHTPQGATPEQITLATAISDGHNILSVAATKTSITDDGLDETIITCLELTTNFDYTVWVNGTISISGSISDGTMEYSSNQSGIHTIEIREQGTYNTGYAIIAVGEVV
jgi:hypothetical protein